MNSAGKQSDGSAKLENQIAYIKYTLFCFNVIAWIVGTALFGLTIWIRSEPGFEEWVDLLNIYVYYIGIYILILLSVIMMIVSFLGCCSALMEHSMALYLFIGSQVACFLIATVGSAILLDYSTMNSSIQPLIRQSMTRLIMTSNHPPSASTLKMIQENIGCCGADGPNDYMVLRQPLPSECRDTVTGNAFFHGCIDELTWFLEDKSMWVAAVAMTIALVNIINAVLSLVLVQALKKEEDEARTYRH